MHGLGAGSHNDGDSGSRLAASGSVRHVVVTILLDLAVVGGLVRALGALRRDGVGLAGVASRLVRGRLVRSDGVGLAGVASGLGSSRLVLAREPSGSGRGGGSRGNSLYLKKNIQYKFLKIKN